MRPEFVRVVPDEIERYGLLAATVLAHIRYRCESDRIDSLIEREGLHWWRVSHQDMGREIGVTARSIRTALRALDQAVTAKHFPPLADQSLAYRVPSDATAVTCQLTETSPSDLPVDESVMPVDESVAVPRPFGHLPATERSSALLLETGEKRENAAADARASVGRPPFGNQQTSELPPSPYCADHPSGTTGKCGACGAARVAAKSWERGQANQRAEAAREAKATIADCPLCDEGWLIGDDGTPIEPARRCTHTPMRSLR